MEKDYKKVFEDFFQLNERDKLKFQRNQVIKI